MVAVAPSLLVSRLDDSCRKALESAAGQAVTRTHYEIGIEHVFLALLDRPGNDWDALTGHFAVDTDSLRDDLNTRLNDLRVGCTRLPALSPELLELVEKAWVFGSIEHQAQAVRSGHLLLALLLDAGFARRALDISKQFARIGAAQLIDTFAATVADSNEAEGPQPRTAVAPDASTPAGAEALDRFTIDLTQRARDGAIDPILGRDNEIRQAADILLRRRQNNPILTGEAGVGKTAVVEGLALRIAQGDVPSALRDVALRTLDLGLLQAGAGMKGEFENRLKSVIDAVQASPKPIILFIDEAHTLIGAGGQQGQNDAANLLKPALARGGLRMIAATTWAEYKKYFEKDAALARRFQVIKVEEPSEATAIDMLRGLIGTLETHHKVKVLDEALSAAVRLSARFIPARQLPDKAVSLIDTACARVAMSQDAVPASVEDRRRRLELIDAETRVLGRESTTGGEHAERLAALAEERSTVATDLAALETRWSEELRLVRTVNEARTRIEATEGGDIEALQSELARQTATLRSLQGEAPLVFPVVDGQAVAAVVQDWTGIPVGRMRSDEIRSVLGLRTAMERRIVSQPYALDVIAQAIHTSRAGLVDPRKPIGVFMLVGTSGTGKTETALTLAEQLYGGEQSMTVINMTEFKEEHKVSLLMGSPPGYVGFGEGGILTEAARRRPYSVILLDEIEKAHPGVQDIFFQVFDKGTMKDGEGRDVDFKNTIIVMTSNAASDELERLTSGPGERPDAASLAVALRPALLDYFKPAFLGRVTIVPYLPLDSAAIGRIVALQLGRIRDRVRTVYRATLTWQPEVAETIAARCTESSAGARNIETILSQTLLPQVSAALLTHMAEEKPVKEIQLSVDIHGGISYNIV